MPTELIAYIGAAVMVAVAFVAYRYWRSTATFARKARESRARQMLESYQTTSVLPPPAPAVEPLPEGEAGSVVAPELDEGSVDAAFEAVEERSAEFDDETPDDADDTAGEEASDEIESEPAIAPSDETLVNTLADGDAIPEETPAVPDAGDGATVAELDEEPDEPEAIEPERTDTVRTDAIEPSIRLIEDLEPRTASTPTANGSLTQLIKEVDEQIEALPIGIELMELPLVERRRVADRREDLKRDRARLLEERKGGNHRRRRRRRKDSTA